MAGAKKIKIQEKQKTKIQKSFTKENVSRIDKNKDKDSIDTESDEVGSPSGPSPTDVSSDGHSSNKNETNIMSSSSSSGGRCQEKFQERNPDKPEQTDIRNNNGNNNGNHRLRVSKACDRCKKQKIKCDGVNPCKICVKFNLKCSYTSSSVYKSKASANDNSNGSSNYDRHPDERLLDRIAELESVVKLQRELLSSQINSNSNSNLCLTSTNLSQSLNPKTFREYSYSMNSYNIVSQRVNLYSLNGFTRSVCHDIWNRLSDESKKFVVLPRTQNYGWNMCGRHFLPPISFTSNNTNNDIPTHLISKELSKKLIDNFFNNINPLFCILEKQRFTKLLKMHSNRTNKSESRLFTAILHSVYAISMRFMERPGFSWDQQLPEHLRETLKENPFQGLEEKLINDSYNTLSAFKFEWESLEIIQGWLLLALYMRAAHRQSSAYSCLGVAVRMCIGMGLMIDLDKDVPGEKESDEINNRRKQIFWSCYIMEHFTCLSIGRVPMIKNEDIRIEFPKNEYSPEWCNKLFWALTKLAIILSKIRSPQMTIDQVPILYEELLNWNKTMNNYRLSNDNDLNSTEYPIELVAMLRLNYHLLVFILHAPFLIPTRTIGINIPSTINPLLNSAEGVSNIVNNLMSLNLITIPWWLFLYLTFHSAVIMCSTINSGHSKVNQIAKSLKNCINVLEYLDNTGYYRMAKEALWAAKMINYMSFLSYRETASQLENAGIDHKNMHKVNLKNFSVPRIDVSTIVTRDVQTNGQHDSTNPNNNTVHDQSNSNIISSENSNTSDQLRFVVQGNSIIENDFQSANNLKQTSSEGLSFTNGYNPSPNSNLNLNLNSNLNINSNSNLNLQNFGNGVVNPQTQNFLQNNQTMNEAGYLFPTMNQSFNNNSPSLINHNLEIQQQQQQQQSIQQQYQNGQFAQFSTSPPGSTDADDMAWFYNWNWNIENDLSSILLNTDSSPLKFDMDNNET